VASAWGWDVRLMKLTAGPCSGVVVRVGLDWGCWWSECRAEMSHGWMISMQSYRCDLGMLYEILVIEMEFGDHLKG
jgi:hypothetical protein